jgi:ABC-2 type transport system ATP-binding protein
VTATELLPTDVASSGSPAVEILDLRMTYGRPWWLLGARRRVEALRGVSLAVERGETFGVLGHNGAGKTTLVKILATLLVPTEGLVSVDGLDVVRDPKLVRRRIGIVLGGDRALYWKLTGRENLRYSAALYGISWREAQERLAELDTRLELGVALDRRVELLSRGMKQKLHLTRALIRKPSLLLLDEPTIGLDAASARAAREVIKELRSEGCTVVLTTHNTTEAEQLCDRIAVLSAGEVLALGRPETIVRRARLATVITVKLSTDSQAACARLRSMSDVQAVVSEAGDRETAIRIVSTWGDDWPSRLLPALNGCTVISVEVNRPTLEDSYLHLVEKATAGS